MRYANNGTGLIDPSVRRWHDRRVSRVLEFRRHSHRTRRPWLVEMLEDRTLLSTYTVQSLADSGDGTLRWAIDQANQHTGADTINFAVSGTILLDSAMADLSDSTGATDVEGPGAANLTVSRNSATGTPEFRIFTVQAGADVTIAGLTISGGKLTVEVGADGGGIENLGTLTVSSATVSGNSVGDRQIPAPPGSGSSGRGGGIFNSGTLTIQGSTLSSNSALAPSQTAKGGGIYNNGGTVTISTSTFSGNTANLGMGGGIFTASGTVTITDSTLSGNASVLGGGGGIYIGGGVATINTSTLSGNTASGLATVGGGIYSGGGTLSLTACTLSGNTASFGGGIGNGNDANITLTASTLSGNTAIGGPAGRILSPASGGGISNAGTLLITGSTLSANVANEPGIGGAGGSGGGISNSGTLTVTDSIISSNSSAGFKGLGGSGGGIANTGTATVTTSTLSGNSGGGIGNDGTLRLTGSVVRDNSGRGISNSDMLTVINSTVSGHSLDQVDGAGISNSGTATIIASTISGNSVQSGPAIIAVYGGGIANKGTITVSNSTVSGNSATAGPGGSGGFGGGISNTGTLLITASTISGNSAASGGGIFARDAGALSATTSLFANPGGGDLVVQAGVKFVSGGHNLFSDAPTVALDRTDLTNTDPLLGPLADNGGPTRTMALLPGSPAIDAGILVPGVTTDQRGVPRPQGSAPDIGAFESRGFTLTIISGNNQSTAAGSAFAEALVVTVASPVGEPIAGGQVTFLVPPSGLSVVLSGNPATIGSDGRASVQAVASGLGGTYTVSTRATGASSGIFILTNLVPPTVADLTRLGPVDHVATLVLRFTAAMDAFRAGDPTSYRLVGAGPDHRLGTKDDRVIPIRGAQYDPATWSVALQPIRPLSASQTYELTVMGTHPGGLTDASGAFLDGAGTGRPGTDYIRRFRVKDLANATPAALLFNGSFETPAVPAGKKARTFVAGDQALTSWRVTTGSVDVQSYWPTIGGIQTIDLNGVARGGIQQAFPTVPGQTYQFSFHYANNPDRPGRTATATVTVIGGSVLLSRVISHKGSKPEQMRYAQFVATFVADSSSTTVQFTSTTPGFYGIVLDAVSVEAMS
jgi:choice-of-anchor C domain-containing protein